MDVVDILRRNDGVTGNVTDLMFESITNVLESCGTVVADDEYYYDYTSDLVGHVDTVYKVDGMDFLLRYQIQLPETPERHEYTYSFFKLQ